MSISVKDAAGATQSINTLPALGFAPGAYALPVALATDGDHARGSDITALRTALTPSGGLPVSFSGTFAATQSGTWTVGLATGATVALLGGNTVAIKTDSSAVTQPISASVLPLPSGAATATKQDTGNTALTQIATALGSPLQAGGSIGNTAFGISGTLPAFAATPTFNLGTLNGAATSAKQDTIAAAVTATGPGTDAFTITPSDTTSFTTNARSIYVGGAGDVTIVTPVGTVVTFKAVPVGSILPVQARRVNTTATTATNLVGLV